MNKQRQLTRLITRQVSLSVFMRGLEYKQSQGHDVDKEIISMDRTMRSLQDDIETLRAEIDLEDNRRD